ncbi:Ubiquitin carboxyl-terminal hydrolase ZUFSP [Holothuria leucospilota]|uniref:Ubiquitin carboxyl-terminal hydrolase ZUFSP n=1 Tax=Holothuria leucospilota TaxID=206669 RepID=A0A9Q1BI64_HOLLE|nr:Ubiquitin carboxyl-terminal hydrolase ZUFSP [Holothuria leucospilota]
MNVDKSENGIVCCEICGQDFETVELVRLHMREEHEAFGAQCPLCDLKHVSIDELNLHVNTAHVDILSPSRQKEAFSSVNTLSTGGLHVTEVPPRSFPPNGITSTSKLTPSKEFCSPKKDGTSMEVESSDSESVEEISMKVFLDSTISSESESNFGEPIDAERSETTSDGGNFMGKESDGKLNEENVPENPLKKVIGNLSPGKWKLWGENDTSRMKKESKGLWQDVGLSGGHLDQEEDVPFVVDYSDDELSDSPETGLGRVAVKPKETLLSLSKNAKHVEEPILCPFCGLGNYDPNVIQNHIEAEHSDADVKEMVTPKSPKLEQVTSDKMMTDLSVENTSSRVKRKLYQDGDQFVGADNEDENHSCPVCNLEGLSQDEMNDHVNSHFEPNTNEDNLEVSEDRLIAEQLQKQERDLQERREKEAFKQLQAQYGMDETGSYQVQAQKKLDKALVKGEVGIANYYHQKSKLQRMQSTGEEDNRCRTSGIINSLSRFYDSNALNIAFARLAEHTDHYASSPGCRGWGCGYRNLQMLLSAMWHDPKYREVVFNGKNAIPSITYIQKLIENAWKKGFDPAGMEQLGNRLVNTRKWIGATEVTALLQSLRVKCKLVDFHKSTGQAGTHPRMFEWVKDYFGKPSTLRILGKEDTALSQKMPLYLQHQGHSRTIIGCEVLKDGATRLLIFDPSNKQNDMAALRAGNITGATLRPLRKTLGQLKHVQYQIVAVCGVMTSDKEYEKSKLLVSERIP